MSKVFMASVDPISIVDLDDKIADLNDEALKAYGLSREQLIGKPVSMIVPAEWQKQMSDHLERCRHGDVIQKVKDVFVNRTGEEFSRSLALSLLTDDQGRPNAIALRTRRMGE